MGRFLEQHREVNEVRKINFPLQNIVKILPSNFLGLSQFSKVHVAIKNIFPLRVNPQLPLAGRLGYYIKNWEKITQDQNILQLVKGYQIPFLKHPKQDRPPPKSSWSLEEQKLIDQEVQKMLQKGAIQEVPSIQGQFLSSIFLVPKKGLGYRPVINLKSLNHYIPYQHFKMEGLHFLKDLLQKGDYMCKLDLKDAYFSVPLHQDFQKFVRFQWKEKIYQFLCLCFGLGPAPRMFTKLMKVPMALLRRLNIRAIVFLDDILVIASTEEEAVMARDTLIYILQSLGFMVNVEKSELNPTQKLEFLGVIVDSLEMSLALPQGKKDKVINQCSQLLNEKEVSIRELTQLIGRLSSSAIAVLPAPLHYRAMQRQQILELAGKNNFEAQITLSSKVRMELNWWIENLNLCQGKSLIAPTAQLQISSDASLKGWGAACRGHKTGGPWSDQEKQCHINLLELKAAKFAILTFVKLFPKSKSIHIQMDNIVALSYLVKMGGTQSEALSGLSKEIWDFLLTKQITIAAEYLPRILNVEAGAQSRSVKDSSE